MAIPYEMPFLPRRRFCCCRLSKSAGCIPHSTPPRLRPLRSPRLTAEAIEEAPLKVIKKDDTREPFDSGKIRRGLERACYKRPVSSAQIDEIVRQVESEIYADYFAEVPAAMIGEVLMPRLKQLDQVAYVRFASVYREFKDVNDFMQEVQPMLNRQKRKTKPRR